MKRDILWSVQTACIMLTVSSCTDVQEKPAQQAPSATESPQPSAQRNAPAPARLHALHSDRLQVIMGRMGTQVVKTWPQEMEPPADAHDAARFEEARELAAALVGAAARIPDAVQGVSISDADRRQFMGNVKLLQSGAERLQAAAAGRDTRDMKSALASIQNTCNGCHAQFREIAGPIQFGHR